MMLAINELRSFPAPGPCPQARVRKRARVGGKWRPITSMKEQAVVAGGYPTSEGRERRTDADDGD